MQAQKLIAGVDEAGRGCIAGPVVAAAVILPEDFPERILNDSKKLTEAQREKAYEVIVEKAIWGVGEVDAAGIDKIGIKPATNTAMALAVENLKTKPQELWVDGNDNFTFDIPAKFFVRGDARFAAISAASIIAKVWRDRIMQKYAKKYPGYSFANHKGYGTLYHMRKLLTLRPTAIHRKSYEPLKTWSVQGRLF